MSDSAPSSVSDSTDISDTIGSAFLSAALQSNPLTAPLAGSSALVAPAVKAAAGAGVTVATSAMANYVLIGVGIVLALGALLISQKQPIANITTAAAGAIRSGAGALA